MEGILLNPRQAPERKARREPARGRHPCGHIPALDGIRGIAIIAVMVFHFFLFGGLSPQNKIDGIFYAVAKMGWAGVDLFFVLSGFLITGILHDSRGNDGFFRIFYARRFFRIFPLYYGALVLFLVVLPLSGAAWKALETGPKEQFWLWAYVTNIRIALDNDWGRVPKALIHFWSLAVEEQFYLAWPFLVYFASRRVVLRLCAGARGLNSG
jgi:peptidoglycan/LPS O-acetylase OafA/YrhL